MKDQNGYYSHIASGGVHHHCLEDHLRGVAQLANGYAASFGSSDWAYLAGLWHDLGKYNPEFQQYLRTVTADKVEDGHLEDVEAIMPSRGPDHSTAGAAYAQERMGIQGRVLAYLIAGHHAGLADWSSGEGMSHGALSVRLRDRGKKCLDQVRTLAASDILESPLPTSAPPSRDGLALWIRMLFSCLVDADFLDTEAFMDGQKAAQRRQYPSLDRMRQQYHAHMKQKQEASEETDVNRIRSEILQQCLAAAGKSTGMFSLSVPTGGGKTLASLGFALEHAAIHGKQRMIYVIPYTSIIEQTAEVFRGIFGENAVVEHHSQFDPQSSSQDNTRQRLASENWDAPLIVTTNVQFFESLYAARTSRVRKLHNIANSVVILDEAQLLPPELLDPIRHSMNELMRYYGVTFVLSTATQPMLDCPPLKTGASQKIIFPDRQEIVTNPQQLYHDLRRVDVVVRKERQNWEDLASELTEHPRVLCIVNRRGDCRQLHELMSEGTVHLSALMCGAHRSGIITEIKEKLKTKDGSPLRVISTQLVEAGVDVDFPVVYRAMAGLDSIAQAAGRCNREGGLQGHGKVVIFIPPDDAPRGLLATAEHAGKFALGNVKDGDDPLQPQHFDAFFDEYYGSVARGQGYDSRNILDCLKPNGELAFQFRSTANKFQMIDTVYLPVIVSYGEGKNMIEGLRSGWLDRSILRKAQRYSVTIPQTVHKALVASGDVQEIPELPGIYVQCNPNLYHPTLGFVPERNLEYGAEDLMA